MICDMIMIASIVTFIIDVSGAPENLFKPIARKLLGMNSKANIKLGPLECSMCAVFWILMTYVMFVDLSIANLMFACMLSMFARTIGSIMNFAVDVVDSIIHWISKNTVEKL